MKSINYHCLRFLLLFSSLTTFSSSSLAGVISNPGRFLPLHCRANGLGVDNAQFFTENHRVIDGNMTFDECDVFSRHVNHALVCNIVGGDGKHLYRGHTFVYDVEGRQILDKLVTQIGFSHLSDGRTEITPTLSCLLTLKYSTSRFICLPSKEANSGTGNYQDDFQIFDYVEEKLIDPEIYSLDECLKRLNSATPNLTDRQVIESESRNLIEQYLFSSVSVEQVFVH